METTQWHESNAPPELLIEQSPINLKTVIVSDIKMNFDSMVTFIVKWGLATAVASLILIPIYAIIWFIVMFLISNF